MSKIRMESGMPKEWSPAGDPSEPCWLWTGALQANGYAAFRVGGKTVRGHRYIFETLRGDIPDGLELDHLCRRRSCCNPAHMEPVTRSENLKRSPLVMERGRRWGLAFGRARGLANRKHKHLPEGVTPNGKSFQAKITVDGRRLHLGTFPTADAARQAFESACAEKIRAAAPHVRNFDALGWVAEALGIDISARLG